MDKNGNENCLEGWECPDCGNHDMFRVESRIFVEVYDSGTGNDDGHTEYDGASRCICGTCGKEANVAYFTQAIRPEYAEKPADENDLTKRVEHYRCLFKKHGVSTGTPDWDQVIDVLRDHDEWSTEGAEALIQASGIWGAWLLRHAAAVAAALEVEDGEAKF